MLFQDLDLAEEVWQLTVSQAAIERLCFPAAAPRRMGDQHRVRGVIRRLLGGVDYVEASRFGFHPHIGDDHLEDARVISARL